MKFEYKQIYVSIVDSLNHLPYLNELGSEGWQLIEAIKTDDKTIMYIFKREIKENLILEGENKNV